LSEAGYAAIVVVGVGLASLAGFAIAGLPSVRRIRLFAAAVTGVLVWFLVRSIPDSVTTLTAQILRLVAPRLAGPLEAKQLEIGLAVQGAEFVAAVLVLVAYGVGMRHARAPLSTQSIRVIRIRLGALVAASLCWPLWAPHFLSKPPAGSGLGIALSMLALGAAIAILVERNQMEPGPRGRLLATCLGLAVLGALLSQLPVPGLVLVLAAGVSAVAFVYMVGQLVELTTLDMRLAGHGGMLPATIAGFVVGLALGR
jgi:hypothetical protein